MLATHPSMIRSMAPPIPRRTAPTGTAIRTSPIPYSGMHQSTVCTEMNAMERIPRSVSMPESLTQACPPRQRRARDAHHLFGTSR